MSAIQSPESVQLAFFSYAHEDAEFALRLAKDLRAAGAGVWIDRLDIKVGQLWDRAVEEALAKCPQLLVILSPASVDSTNVMDEVSFALDKRKAVLPVIHRQCEIPFRLRRLHYVDFTLNYDEGLGRLLEALGFTEPPSKLTEDTVKQQGRAGSTSPPFWHKSIFVVVAIAVLIAVGAAGWLLVRKKESGQAAVRTQTHLPTVTSQTVPSAAQEWQVVIGDYPDQNEAGRKKNHAAQLGYSNSEIFGNPPHLQMRFRFSSREEAITAANKLKAWGVSNTPQVLHSYRP